MNDESRCTDSSKQEIAEIVATIAGGVHEAIVFVEEPAAPGGSAADSFAVMEPFTVRQVSVDDSREAIYRGRVILPGTTLVARLMNTTDRDLRCMMPLNGLA